jgi:alkaline phosphatase
MDEKEKNVKRFLLKSSMLFPAVVLFMIPVMMRPAELPASKAPKNVILIIGDGMGVAQITAGKVQKGNLSLEKFTTTGLIATHSADSFATDSAAAATAMATGEKTCNYRVAVDCDGKPIKTVLEWAEEAGMSTGVVVTSSVTDATPAAFMAHVENRFRQAQIAEQIAACGVDILFGGGWSYFIPKSEQGSRRNDERDLLGELRGKMKVIRTPGEFRDFGSDKAAAALFASGAMDRAKSRQPSLAALTKKALEILAKSEKGFFLLIEGSQIDLAGHDNDSEALIEEVLDLDDAIQASFEFASGNGETLVVVTADHETGGFALHKGSVRDKVITESAFTSINHTASMVPLFAFGPGKDAFAGIHDNVAVGKTLIRYVRKDSN